MGDSYSVLPLAADPGIPEWLVQLGIPVPPIPVTNRYPSLREFRTAFADMEGFAVKFCFGHGCDIDVSGVNAEGHEIYACVWTRNFTGDEDVPLEFHFHKGWIELNLEITRRLSVICGPFIVVSVSSGMPIVVTPDIDIAKAILESGEC